MALDAFQWRERGRRLRALESGYGATHPVSQTWAKKALRNALARRLTELLAEEREVAVDLAVEGYLAEHLARGGALTEG